METTAIDVQDLHTSHIGRPARGGRGTARLPIRNAWRPWFWNIPCEADFLAELFASQDDAQLPTEPTHGAVSSPARAGARG